MLSFKNESNTIITPNWYEQNYHECKPLYARLIAYSFKISQWWIQIGTYVGIYWTGNWLGDLFSPMSIQNYVVGILKVTNCKSNMSCCVVIDMKLN